jgi:hypothetical protein
MKWIVIAFALVPSVSYALPQAPPAPIVTTTGGHVSAPGVSSSATTHNAGTHSLMGSTATGTGRGPATALGIGVGSPLGAAGTATSSSSGFGSAAAFGVGNISSSAGTGY